MGIPAVLKINEKLKNRAFISIKGAKKKKNFFRKSLLILLNVMFLLVASH